MSTCLTSNGPIQTFLLATAFSFIGLLPNQLRDFDYKKVNAMPNMRHDKGLRSKERFHFGTYVSRTANQLMYALVKKSF